jgi:hypothetical protein
MSEDPEDCWHTPEPLGYLAWHEWADNKSKTHIQVRCPNCNLLKIWVSKRGLVKIENSRQEVSPKVGSADVARN